MSNSVELLLNLVLFVVAGVIAGVIAAFVGTLLKQKSQRQLTSASPHEETFGQPKITAAPTANSAPRVNRYGELEEL